MFYGANIVETAYRLIFVGSLILVKEFLGITLIDLGLGA